MSKGRKPKRNNRKKADSQEKTRGGQKEGTKTTAGKERVTRFDYLASVQHGKFPAEECRKKPLANYQDAKKPYGADKTDKEKRHMKTSLSDRNAQSVNCINKSPQDEMIIKMRKNDEDKSKNLSGGVKEDSQRKMKIAEKMEVKALDTWTAVHDKKPKPQGEKKLTERTSSNEEIFVYRKEEAREQAAKNSTEFQSVEHNEKENKPRKKLQLLEDILKMATQFESSDYVKNPRSGRKESDDQGAIFKIIKSDEEMEKLRTRNEHIAILKTRKECLPQLNNPSVKHTKNMRTIVSSNNLAGDQKPCGQPINGPVNFPARPVDSPYLSDIRQRGKKVLSSSNTKPVPVFPSKQNKSYCNLPEIYGSKKQSNLEVSISSTSDRIPSCIAMRLSPYNKPGSPPATRIHVPCIQPEARIDQVAKNNAPRIPYGGKTPPQLRPFPQSAEEIQKSLQSSKCHVQAKISVDSTKEISVISQKTVSIGCYNQKKGDYGRPIQKNRITNRNGQSHNVSACKTLMSNKPQASRNLSVSWRQGI